MILNTPRDRLAALQYALRRELRMADGWQLWVQYNTPQGDGSVGTEADRSSVRGPCNHIQDTTLPVTP